MQHTQGRAIAHINNNSDYIDIDIDGNRLCSLFIGDEFAEENRANAERIVRLWNSESELALKKAETLLSQYAPTDDDTHYTEEEREEFTETLELLNSLTNEIQS